MYVVYCVSVVILKFSSLLYVIGGFFVPGIVNPSQFFPVSFFLSYNMDMGSSEPSSFINEKISVAEWLLAYHKWLCLMVLVNFVRTALTAVCIWR